MYDWSVKSKDSTGRALMVRVAMAIKVSFVYYICGILGSKYILIKMIFLYFILMQTLRPTMFDKRIPDSSLA